MDIDLTGLLENVQADKPATPLVTCTIERPLDESDIQNYIQNTGSGQLSVRPDGKVENLEKIRARHHSVAQLLARGVAETLVATITGYSPSHISTLKNNPAMQELIAHYRGPDLQLSQIIHQKLQETAFGSLEKLAEKLENNELDPNELLALAKLGFDRSGHGPTSTVNSTTEHRVIDVAKMAELHQAARSSERKNIIDVEDVRSKALPSPGGANVDDAA